MVLWNFLLKCIAFEVSGKNNMTAKNIVVFPTYLQNYTLEQKSPENPFRRVLVELQFE